MDDLKKFCFYSSLHGLLWPGTGCVAVLAKEHDSCPFSRWNFQDLDKRSSQPEPRLDWNVFQWPAILGQKKFPAWSQDGLKCVSVTCYTRNYRPLLMCQPAIKGKRMKAGTGAMRRWWIKVCKMMLSYNLKNIFTLQCLREKIAGHWTAEVCFSFSQVQAWRYSLFWLSPN